MGLLGLVAAFAAIFALRARRVDFALAILAASVIIGATSGKGLGVFWDVAVGTLTDPITLELAAAVALITVLGYSLEETGMMVDLIGSLRGLLPGRVLLALIPALFGLLSMPGGALMSAPFNEPEAERLGLRPEHKTYINVWFRHVWYWASPISPTTILAVSIAGFGLREFIAANLLVFFAAWVIGFLATRSFMRGGPNDGEGRRSYVEAVKGLSPILASVGLTLAGVPVWASLILGLAMLFLLRGVGPGRAFEMFRRGIRWEIVAAVVAMLYFRDMVVYSGSVEGLFQGIMGLGVPILALVILLPLLVGTISGTPTMGIGIVFPLLLPLLASVDVHALSIMLAGIVCGYIGSPIHLCLILTNSYYRSELNRVYRYLVPSVVALYVVSLAYHLALGTL